MQNCEAANELARGVGVPGQVRSPTPCAVTTAAVDEDEDDSILFMDLSNTTGLVRSHALFWIYIFAHKNCIVTV